MTGLLLVDKPAGMTSHDVVDRIRRAARIRRVGHTGTLDPGATGLLILCLGKATRLSEHLTRMDKTYEGAMRLGVVTDSYDMDGRVVEENPVPELGAEEIQRVCSGFVGAIEQIPPMVSAVKVGGERLYKKARKGETVERPARNVMVYEFSVLGYEPPQARVRVRCTSGTYVRSLCHDAGHLLGCGASLAALRRTAVGMHRIEDAAPMDHFTGPDEVRAHLIPIEQALDIPEVSVRDGSRASLLAGNPMTASDLKAPCPIHEGWVQMKDSAGKLLALGQIQPTAAGPRIHPKRVLSD